MVMLRLHLLPEFAALQWGELLLIAGSCSEREPWLAFLFPESARPHKHAVEAALVAD